MTAACIPGQAFEIQGSNVQCETLQVRSCLQVNGVEIVPAVPIGPFVSGQVVFGSPTFGLTQSDKLFWNNVTKFFGIGTNAPAVPLHVINPNAGEWVGRIQASSFAGDAFSGIRFYSDNNSNQPKGSVGFANGAVVFPHMQNKNFWFCTDDNGNHTNIVFANNNANAFEFGVVPTEYFLGMGNGISTPVAIANRGKLVYASNLQRWMVSANTGPFKPIVVDDAGAIQFNDGAAGPVSDAGTARIRYNAGLNIMEVSLNAAAYVPL